MVDKSELPPMTATEDEVVPTRQAYGRNLADDARYEASGILADGMAHPSTKPVLTGAAVGAAASLVLPFIGLPLGIAAGAGYAFYKRLRP